MLEKTGPFGPVFFFLSGTLLTYFINDFPYGVGKINETIYYCFDTPSEQLRIITIMVPKNRYYIFRIEDINAGLKETVSRDLTLEELWCCYRIILQKNHLCYFRCHWSLDTNHLLTEKDVEVLATLVPMIENSVYFRYLYHRMSNLLFFIEEEVERLILSETDLKLIIKHETRHHQPCMLSSPSVSTPPDFIANPNYSHTATTYPIYP